MKIFTNGKLTILRTATHVYRWPRKGESSVDKRKRKSSATEYYHDGLLLVGPSGADLEPTFAEHFEFKTILDADALDEQRVAFLHGDQTLTWGPEPEDDWAQRIDLSAHRSAFPAWASGMRLGPPSVRDDLDDEEEAYERTQHDKLAVGFPNGTLLANENGIGVASNFSGNVALFRPDAAEAVLTLRLGTVDEDRIYARPTKKGLLVTVVFNGRNSTLFHVDEKGKLLAQVAEEPTGRPPALSMGRHTVDFVDTMAISRNAKLEAVGEVQLSMRPVTAAASTDGRHFAVADSFGGDMALFAIDGKGKLREVARVSYADLRRQAKAAADRTNSDKAFYVKRVPGEPCMGFAAKPVVSPPWTITTGKFALPLVVRSAGGPGKGIAVRLSGAALEGLTLTGASVGADTVAFRPDGDGQVAELPDTPLSEGVVFPFDPKPTSDSQKAIAEAVLRESHLQLVVHGSAAKASSAILRVEVSALGASSSPLKWMRPLVVRDAG